MRLLNLSRLNKIKTAGELLAGGLFECYNHASKMKRNKRYFRAIPFMMKEIAMGRKADDVDDKYMERLNEDAEHIAKEDVQKLIDKGTAKAERLKNSKNNLVVRLCKQFKLVYMMLRDWLRGSYDCPWKTIAGLTAAAIYFLNPFDIIPDLLPIIGLTDDASVMLLAISLNHFDLLEYCEKMGLDPRDYGLNASDNKDDKK